MTGLPVVHLDEQHWRPGWTPTPREDWRAWQEEHLVADGCWIADGNYSSTMDVRLSRADTVVLLFAPRGRRVRRVLRRTLGSLGRPVQAPGCPERLDPAFVRWVWRYDLDTRPRVEDAVRRLAAAADVHRLTSDAEVGVFLRRAARS
ncbi:P-loop NTPase family protein [Angustibacter speluncae]